MYVIIISGSNHKTKINIGKLLKNCFTSEKTRYIRKLKAGMYQALLKN